MMDRQHSLPLNHHSIVGFSISSGEPRIVNDVGIDSVYFTNPDLPETRSEIALPLRAGGHIIGALDVQSTQTNAFSAEDVSLLSTLADQVAMAIENARLFGEAQKALAKSRAVFEKYTQQEWSNFARQVKQTGFLFDGKQVSPINSNEERENVKKVSQTGSLSLEKESASIAIPIKLRGQTIGVIDVRSKKGERQWKPEEISMLEAAAERAGSRIRDRPFGGKCAAACSPRACDRRYFRENRCRQQPGINPPDRRGRVGTQDWRRSRGFARNQQW